MRKLLVYKFDEIYKEEVEKGCLKLLKRFRRKPKKQKNKLLYNLDESKFLGGIYVLYKENLKFFEFGLYQNNEKIPIFYFRRPKRFYKFKIPVYYIQEEFPYIDLEYFFSDNNFGFLQNLEGDFE